MSEEMIRIPARLLTEQALLAFCNAYSDTGISNYQLFVSCLRGEHFGIKPEWKPEVGKMAKTRSGRLVVVECLYGEYSWVREPSVYTNLYRQCDSEPFTLRVECLFPVHSDAEVHP